MPVPQPSGPGSPQQPQHRVGPTHPQQKPWAGTSLAGQAGTVYLSSRLTATCEECPSGSSLYHSLTSPEASASVLAAVTQTLMQYPFDFRGARILSGQDEGVFGWVTTNYLLENFIKVGLPASPRSQGCGHPPTG